MTPLELERIGKRIYGKFRWRSLLALNLGVDTATVHRWGYRGKQLPYIVEVAVRGLLERHKIVAEEEKRQKERDRKAGKLRPKLKRKRRKKNVKISSRGVRPAAVRSDTDLAIDTADPPPASSVDV